ncbi:MAG: PilZ domain-containing protein [Candidatus Omnitrophica bacterium]|nr:PilZ domain-containing protein [Candidatus Omnitrophota bacterium]
MQENRRFSRIAFREPVEYNIFGEMEGNRTFGGFLSCDLGEGGIRIYANDFIPLNTTIKLNFYINSEKMVEVEGRVVWSQKSPHGESYQLGLEFSEHESNSTARGNLHQYIDSLQF